MSMGIGAANLGITVAASSKVSSVGIQVSTVQSKVDSVGVQTSTAVSTAASVGVLTSATVSTAISKVDSVGITASTNTSKVSSVGVQTSTVQSKVDSVGVQVTAIPAAVVSNASATTAGVIVQDGATGTATLATVNLPGSANTFTSWTQVDASASADSWIMGFCFSISAEVSNARSYCVEIGTGANPNEVTKVRVSFRHVNTITGGGVGPLFIPLPVPIKVSSGTRIAYRVSDNAGGADATWLGLSMYQSLET